MTIQLLNFKPLYDTLLTVPTRRLVLFAFAKKIGHGQYIGGPWRSMLQAWGPRRGSKGQYIARGMSRTIARIVIAIIAVLGLFLFIYLTEVTQVTTTAFDIEQMKLEYHQLQKLNQELEREIAELESPEQVQHYAKSNGMVARTDRKYIFIEK